MTNFQRELLKNRDKVYFHYDKSNVKISVEENEVNGIVDDKLFIQLEYLYYFDYSLLDINDFKEICQETLSFQEENNQSFVDKIFKKEDSFFRHKININISLNELKKNTLINKLTKNEIEEYLKEKFLANEFKELVFNIGLVEAISYYKIFPVQNIIVIGELKDYQKQWWSKLIYNGLGEYRYLNSLLSIDEDKFVNIISNSKLDEYYNKDSIDKNIDNKYLDIEKQGFLIPIGGGKDSVVTIELLKEFKDVNTLFAIDNKGARVRTAEVAGYKKNEVVEVNRIFDSKLEVKNEQGFFNGHIPFSSVVAFISVLTAYILNKKYIPLSNESSANEPTVMNLNINHQYSKAIEFERDFREYIDFLDIDIEYFSLLRPLTEVGIAKIFAKHEKYFKAFNSCNVGSKSEEWYWCCDCPKCLFAYIILAPFLYKEELVKIFKKDIFENVNLLEDMYKLLGKRDAKPFECVGTSEETKFSLSKLMDKLIMEKKASNLPILLEKYREIYEHEKTKELKISNNRGHEAPTLEKIDETKNLYMIYNKENFLPDFLEEIVKKAIQE